MLFIIKHLELIVNIFYKLNLELTVFQIKVYLICSFLRNVFNHTNYKLYSQ